MKRLAILGASGHGKVAADCAECVGWGDVTFFDDAWPEISVAGHWPVKGDSSALFGSLTSFDGVFVAIGTNVTRSRKLQELEAAGARLVSLVHPSAVVSRYASVGIGCLVCAGAVVNVDSVLGPGVIVNTGATVDHDCDLGRCVHISPGVGLAGGVHVGAHSWVGIGASVRQLVSIGSDVVVGAGAVVLNDIPNGVTVVGVPARSKG